MTLHNPQSLHILMPSTNSLLTWTILPELQLVVAMTDVTSRWQGGEGWELWCFNDAAVERLWQRTLAVIGRLQWCAIVVDGLWKSLVITLKTQELDGHHFAWKQKLGTHYYNFFLRGFTQLGRLSDSQIN